MTTIEDITKRKRVLAFVAHPDDFEDYFGGTFSYLLDKDLVNPQDISIVVCTDGGKGGRDAYTDASDLVQRRMQEQKKSIAFLGIPETNLFFLMLEDGFLHKQQDLLLERMVYFIRKIKPDLICTHNGMNTIIENHIGIYAIHQDHRSVGNTAMDAVYPYSRDLLFFPEHQEESLGGHTVTEVLLAESAKANMTVDITDYIEKKRNLLRVFASQFDNEADLEKHIKTMYANDNKYYESFQHLHIII